MPKKRCFTAAYPNTEWQEVPCTTAPPYPQPPRRGPRPDVVGGSNDVGAQGTKRVHIHGDRLFRQRHRRNEREWTDCQHGTIGC
jgi:hypothetical protein